MNLSQDIALKIAKFKSDPRANFSLTLLLIAFVITLPAELICNVRPLLLVVDGKPYFPVLFTYNEVDFGGTVTREPDYKSENFIRLLKGFEEKPLAIPPTENETEELGLNIGLGDFEDDNGLAITLDDFDESEKPATPDFPLALGLDDFGEEPETKPQATVEPKKSYKPIQPTDFWMFWPPVRYDYKYIPTASRSGVVVLAAPYKTANRTVPSAWLDGHYLGTDDRGRDVLARLIYGFRISLIFGLSLAIAGTLMGCIIGGIQGFFGGWIDLIGQRFTEIWGSMPRLYLLIILSSFLVPSAWLLFLILNLTAWMGIAAYIRAEFLKSRNLEYVKAAKAMGVSHFEIIRRHILPNSLTPVITFFPFEVTAGILALVSLDYLNLGVPSPAPSMGELLAQGKNNLQAIWIILPTFFVLTGTLTLLTFIGEGIRNAFDPRKSLNNTT